MKKIHCPYCHPTFDIIIKPSTDKYEALITEIWYKFLMWDLVGKPTENIWYDYYHY